jgi:hypothetical protein
MKFTLESGGEIEISGITCVVENSVEYKDGKKQRVAGESWAWIRNSGKKGLYWTKYPYKDSHDLGGVCGGMSHEDMLGYIYGAAFSASGRVWFEGACCNIEKDIVLYEQTQKKLAEAITMYEAIRDAIEEITDTVIAKIRRNEKP